MSTIGKEGISYRKKNVRESKLPVVAAQPLVFAHESIGGETSIDFYNLQQPASWTFSGRQNPSTSRILNAKLYNIQNNVNITSSMGIPIQKGSYIVRNDHIDFIAPFESRPGEVFEISVADVLVTGGTLLADARPIFKPGLLLAGQTDFNVGELFEVGREPQAIMVFRGALTEFPKPMYRNTNNSSTVLDGNYYEMNNGTGHGTVVRFNIPAGASDELIMVMSIGALVERPNLSQLQFIEHLASQLDSMIPTLAALAGVPESNFGGGVSYPDLKAFGDRVLNLEGDILLTQTKVNEVIDSILNPPVTVVYNTNNTVPGASVNNTYEIDSGFRLTVPETAYYDLEVACNWVWQSSSATVGVRVDVQNLSWANIWFWWLDYSNDGDYRRTKWQRFIKKNVLLNAGMILGVRMEGSTYSSGGATVSALGFFNAYNHSQGNYLRITKKPSIANLVLP